MDGEIDRFIEAYLKKKLAKGADQPSTVGKPEDDI
jgi:hypothetical protein